MICGLQTLDRQHQNAFSTNSRQQSTVYAPKLAGPDQTPRWIWHVSDKLSMSRLQRYAPIILKF